MFFIAFFLVLRLSVIALWSKREFCSAGQISQDDAAANNGTDIKKKSSLDLFSWLMFRGQNEKSCLDGKKRRYGSVKLWERQSSLTSIECLELGRLTIFLQSIFRWIGSDEKVCTVPVPP